MAACASLVFAAACDGRSSPTAADGPLQQRIRGIVTDEVGPPAFPTPQSVCWADR